MELTPFCDCSGMLPGFVAGFYTFDECHIDLSKLAAFANARLVHATCSGIDHAQQEVHFADRPPLPYDCLSIDTGIAPSLRDVPGWQHVTPVKPINTCALLFELL
jgi:selenide, water dikinase